MKDRNIITERIYDFSNKEQVKTYEQFDKENISNRMGQSYRYSHFITMRRLGACVNKPFEKVTKQDLIDYFAHLSGEVGERTQTLYQICTRTFFNWMGKKEAISWMKIKRTRKIRLPSDIPTKKEIFTLIEKTPYPKDKALISLLWDSAARIGEVTNLKVKDLIFDEFGGYIIVDGKTGMRKIRLIDSIPYLKNYLNENKKDREDFLFTSRYSFMRNKETNQVDGGSVYTMLERLRKKCGIKRIVSPHRIRHRKLTEMAKQGFSEMDLRLFAGWSKSSEMASIYVHITDVEVGDKILKKAGIKKEEDMPEDNELMPKKCIDPDCKHENPATAKFCEKCHRPLTIQSIKLVESKCLVEGMAKYEGITEDDTKALKALINKLFDKGILDPKEFIKEY